MAEKPPLRTQNMKKIQYTAAFAAAFSFLLAMTGCDPDNNPNDPNGGSQTESFPKMILLEQFTSESCVNCPSGVMQIDAYLAKHPQTIWLGHHAGYGNDQWTISASTALANYLGVQGAPTVSLDRADYSVYGSQIVYHPYYLAGAKNLPTTTYASVNIRTTCSDHHATIHVEGSVAKGHSEQLLLSVVIKENGLHGKQMDPNNTLAGSWEDYIHSNTIRAYVSKTLGDSISVTKGKYAADYTVDLDAAWVPDNCMIVAFLSDTKGLNIVQAAETPVVPGSKGGTDIQHGGVTPKAVPEGYPEGKYSLADFLKVDTVKMEVAQATYTELGNNLREWHINAWTTSQTYGTGPNKYIPLSDIIFFTDASVSDVPQTGDMTFKVAKSVDQIVAGTAWAGICDVEAQKIFGSEIDIVNYESFLVGSIIPGTNGRWLIAENSVLHFTATGFSLDGASASGKPIHIVFNGTYSK